VRAADANNIGKHHSKIRFTKYIHSLIDIRYYQSQDTEIGGLGHRESVHIKTVLAQNFGNLVDTTCLILKEY
jgi:hypothetical protein